MIIGVAMGSPLLPIVANLFMENFEKKALDSFPLMPTRWKRYVDVTNVKWPHGNDKLNKFYEHLNKIFEDIKFTTELKKNRSIPFLDVLITMKWDGTLDHKIVEIISHFRVFLPLSIFPTYFFYYFPSSTPPLDSLFLISFLLSISSYHT
jgi:hypothetical protein